MAKQKWYLSLEQRFRALFRCLPGFFVCWFLHVRVIDLFEDISQLKIKHLQGNLKTMVEKCHNCEIWNIFISGLVYTRKIGLPVFQRTHKTIERLANKLGMLCRLDKYKEEIYLWKDGLHLVKSGKAILAYNFLFYLSLDDIRNSKPGISFSKSSAADLEMLWSFFIIYLLPI